LFDITVKIIILSRNMPPDACRICFYFQARGRICDLWQHKRCAKKPWISETQTMWTHPSRRRTPPHWMGAVLLMTDWRRPCDWASRQCDLRWPFSATLRGTCNRGHLINIANKQGTDNNNRMTWQ